MVSFTALPKSTSLLLLSLNAAFIIPLSLCLTTTFLNPSNDSFSLTFSSPFQPFDAACTGLRHYTDYTSKCVYVRSLAACRSNGYINYLEILYCNFGWFPPLGFSLLALWLVLLFYILANTASDYFCPSVENLSRILKLSPVIAGTTLLPFGNGANDVFASIISFTRSGYGDIGLNSILGGAFFISTVVVGVISIVISSNEIIVDKPSFIRNVLFLIFSLCFLLIILMIGEINFWVAVCFASIYIVYMFVVSAMHFRLGNRTLNLTADWFSEEVEFPLLGWTDEEKCVVGEKCLKENPKQRKTETLSHIGLVLYIMKLPLYLPGRATIPVVSKEKWSKPFAVISVFLAPILLAFVYGTQTEDMGSKTRPAIYVTSGLIGLILGTFAFVFTNKDKPPQSCLLPWLAGGFLMTIVWTYIVAKELVSLLVSAGKISGLSPSILGVTVLSWGNNVGDLIVDVALAKHGGHDGTQIAVAGCYAGPVFNLLVGLGMSLVLASWSDYPASSYVIPTSDGQVYETIGFFIGGLLWALVVLPRNNMKLDRTLGIGLLAIYFCFLSLNVFRALGLLSSSNSG